MALATHGKYGGVVPELASREHLRAIVPVVREAMQQSRTGWDDLAAVAGAFDKVAKLLGFPYPGGPVIDMPAPYMADEIESRRALLRAQANLSLTR
jgi:tRNA A37 threonylcarbamoyltransferase TsaD